MNDKNKLGLPASISTKPNVIKEVTYLGHETDKAIYVATNALMLMHKNKHRHPNLL